MTPDPRKDGIDLSVVIPAYNEAESLRELVPAVARVCLDAKLSYEIWIVDDGSTDDTLGVAASLHEDDPRVGLLSLRRNFGKSAALKTGFEHARGTYVVTLDADLQDDPAEIPLLLTDLEGGLDLVSGWKRTRHDPLSKTLPSRFFNWVVSRVTGIPLHDFNCGLKGYRNEVTKTISLYGEMHRFLPVLAHSQGFRIGEREVRHHPRRFGQSKFGPARFVNGFLDLLEVVFLAGGSRTPLHVFGRIGSICLVLGGVINAYMFVLWVLEGALRVRPLLLFGVILIILGIQFISIGLLAALMHAPASRERDYPLGRAIPTLGSDGDSRSLIDFLGGSGAGGSGAAQGARSRDEGFSDSGTGGSGSGDRPGAGAAPEGRGDELDSGTAQQVSVRRGSVEKGSE